MSYVPPFDELKKKVAEAQARGEVVPPEVLQAIVQHEQRINDALIKLRGKNNDW